MWLGAAGLLVAMVSQEYTTTKGTVAIAESGDVIFHYTSNPPPPPTPLPHPHTHTRPRRIPTFT